MHLLFIKPIFPNTVVVNRNTSCVPIYHDIYYVIKSGAK